MFCVVFFCLFVFRQHKKTKTKDAISVSFRKPHFLTSQHFAILAPIHTICDFRHTKKHLKFQVKRGEQILGQFLTPLLDQFLAQKH